MSLKTLYDELDFISANKDKESYIPYGEFIGNLREAVARGSSDVE